MTSVSGGKAAAHADTVRERVELCREQIAASPFSHTVAAGWYAEDVPALVALAEQLQRERDDAGETQSEKNYAKAYHREREAREQAERRAREDSRKVEAYDAARAVVKREGFSRAEYVLRAEAAEAERDRMEQERDEARAYAESQDWHTEWYAPLRAERDRLAEALRLAYSAVDELCARPGTCILIRARAALAGDGAA